jgi:nucleoside-diphosphate-sugar epimerase
MKIGTDGVLLGAWCPLDNNPKNILDIGANTGKFSVQCLEHNEDVHLHLLDLPVQLNVANANLMSAETRNLNGYYNLGSGFSITINNLVNLLEKIYRKPIQREYLPARKGEVIHSKANIVKIQSKLKFQPDNDLYNGLKEYVNWTKKSL